VVYKQENNLSKNKTFFFLLVPVKTRRSWCKFEYDVDYYNGADRQITNIEISTIISPPPPLVAVTLSLVTLPNTKTHETEVRERDFWIKFKDLF
jgi:hypothetical protein